MATVYITIYDMSNNNYVLTKPHLFFYFELLKSSVANLPFSTHPHTHTHTMLEMIRSIH